MLFIVIRFYPCKNSFQDREYNTLRLYCKMIDIFINSFGTTFQAILPILLIAAVAGFLIRKNILTQEQLKALSAICIQVLLPCLIFSNIIKNFDPHQLRYWLLIPLAAFLMVGFALAISSILFRPNLRAKKHFLAPAAIQNAAYIILPLGKMLYPQKFDEFAMYCFLYVLGLNLILWSVGKYLVSSKEDENPSIRQLLNPPFFANIIAVSVVLLGLKRFMPTVVLNSAELVGSATVPVATFLLGAILGSISFNIKSHFADAGKVMLVKLILLPLAVIIVLSLTNLHTAWPLLCSLLVLQSSSPPATAIIIMAKHYDEKEQQLGSILFLSYVACIITIPFWLAVWSAIIA
jgi:predicted permease